MGSLYTLGVVFLYYYTGILVGKVVDSLWMDEEKCFCTNNGTVKDVDTDRIPELVLLPKIGKFSGTIC